MPAQSSPGPQRNWFQSWVDRAHEMKRPLPSLQTAAAMKLMAMNGVLVV